MANVKISELTSVTTPLAGTETLPVVQSSTTKKATVADVLNSVNATFTANGVAYANGSKVLTTGSALTFDGTNFATTGTASATKFIPTGGTATGNGMYLPTTNTLAWSNNGSETMRLDSSGNLGLGVTPSAWSVIKAIEIGSFRSAFYSDDGSVSVGFTAGSYYNAGWKYAVTGSAVGRYEIAGSAHAWYSAASGTAGNAITFTQAMTLTSAGYLKASNDGTYNNVAGTYHELRTNATANHCLYVHATAAATGNFGIAIQYPNRAPNDTSNEFLACSDSAATRMYVRSNGGISNYQANDTNLSDRREKHDFAPAKRYLDVVCAIPVQTFKYIDQTDDEPTIGVVAQDVQAVAPELVSESNWGTADEPKLRLSVYQTDLQYALMKAIQDLAADNQQLRARVEALEAAQTVVR